MISDTIDYQDQNDWLLVILTWSQRRWHTGLFIVLGDSAYRGLHAKVITPVVGNNLTAEQQAFNNACTRTRQIVERSIGAAELKWRIQQLKYNCIATKKDVVYASHCSVATAVLLNRFTSFLKTTSNSGRSSKSINSGRQPATALMKKLLGPYDVGGLKTIQRGCTHKSVAVTAYERHPNTSVTSTAIWLSTSGSLGDSPNVLFMAI